MKPTFEWIYKQWFWHVGDIYASYRKFASHQCLFWAAKIIFCSFELKKIMKVSKFLEFLALICRSKKQGN